MLSFGFEPQVRTISNQIRPDRQAVLFSATFSKKLKRLAQDLLFKPAEIRSLKVNHQHITQNFVPLKDRPAKVKWILENLTNFVAVGKVLIFLSQRAAVEEVAHRIRNDKGLVCTCIHGDLHQSDRTAAINSFKKDAQILVATDVASRGLHVPNMNTVICGDAARNLDSHTHRIGKLFFFVFHTN